MRNECCSDILQIGCARKYFNHVLHVVGLFMVTLLNITAPCVPPSGWPTGQKTGTNSLIC